MLADIIKEKRIVKNLSKKDFAKKCEISFDTALSLENNDYLKISKKLFNKIKNVIDLNEDFEKKYVSNYNNYGEIIREKRIEKKLSKYKLCKLAGFSLTYIQKLEGNEFEKLSYNCYIKIKDILDLKDDEFSPFFLKNKNLSIKFINNGTFGTLLKQKRVNLELKQNELALKCNIHNSLIAKLEKHPAQNCSYSTAIKIMISLNFSFDEIKIYCPNIVLIQSELENDILNMQFDKEIDEKTSSLTIHNKIKVLDKIR